MNHGSLDRVISEAPRADLNIFGLPQDFEDFRFMRELVRETESACLFVKGSGHENALA